MTRLIKARYLWLVPGLAIAIYASGQGELHGVGLLPLLAFGIAPHVPVLLGFLLPHGRGQLPPRAVPLFNTMHHPVPPLVMLGLAAAGVLPPVVLVAALAWLSHIVIDWALGDGLRTADGYVVARSIWNGRPFGPITMVPRRAHSGGPS